MFLYKHCIKCEHQKPSYIYRSGCYVLEQNMTDYVCYANAGPRFAGKIKSRSTTRSRSTAEPDSPGRRRARGEKQPPAPSPAWRIPKASRGRCAHVLTRSCSPQMKLGAARAAASGRALDSAEIGADGCTMTAKCIIFVVLT